MSIDDTISTVARRVQDLKEQYQTRDRETHTLRLLRDGEWEQLAPGAFTEDYPAPMVANKIDVMARDTAASLTPLPSVSCAAAGGLSASKKAKAEKRTQIANYYIASSNLQARQFDAGDSYNYYGMLSYFVDVDMENNKPAIRVLSGGNTYAVWDGFGDTVLAAEEWEATALTLMEQYPAHATRIEDAVGRSNTAGTVKVIRYSDRQRTVIYLPDVGNLVLTQYEAPIPGKCQYVCVPRSRGTGATFNSVPRGAYVDLVYPQIAKHEFRNLMLEAAYKAVQAPIAVPSDVTTVPYGPDAVIPSQNPQGIGRIPMNVPPGAFQAEQSLDEDIAVGGMSPEARTGNIQASVITGKGIEAATAGYSSQIAAAQMMIGFGLRLAVQRCFMMDEALWPNTKREIRGIENGVPFIGTYIPSKDIAGDYSVEVTYGFMLGMAPNNALIFLLQASAAGLLSKEFAAKQLPLGVNPVEEQRKIELEQLRGSAIQSIAALGQAIPQFVMNDKDPTKVIQAIADVIRRIQRGEEIEEIISKVFVPEPPPQPQQDQLAAAAAGQPQPGGGGGPLSPTSSTPGALPSNGPGDRPDLNQLFAGINGNGNPVLQGGVSRMNPAR